MIRAAVARMPGSGISCPLEYWGEALKHWGDRVPILREAAQTSDFAKMHVGRNGALSFLPRPGRSDDVHVREHQRLGAKPFIVQSFAQGSEAQHEGSDSTECAQSHAGL